MATTTPNYGWDVPTSTDYVKDGATAIETLGDDIDATLYTINNGSGKVGLHLLNTTTFTNQSAVQIDNVFTSTYDNYRVVFSTSAFSGTNIGVFTRFVDGTSPVTTSIYYYAALGLTAGNASTNAAANPSNAFALGFGNSTGGDIFSFAMDVIDPQKAVKTKSFWSSYNFNGTITFTYVGAGEFDGSNQFEGIQIFPSSGNFSGTISVYGYRK